MGINVLVGSRVYWAIYDEIVRAGDNVKRVGVVSCSEALAKWLDVTINNELSFPSLIYEVEAYERTRERLDSNSTEVINVAKHHRSKARKLSNKGGKRITVVTTKEITSSKSKKKGKKYHTGSFNVSAHLSTIDISDWFATNIEASKRSGSTAKMFPYFIMPSGNQHGIMTKERAEALSATQGGSETPANTAALEEMQNKS